MGSRVRQHVRHRQVANIVNSSNTSHHRVFDSLTSPNVPLTPRHFLHASKHDQVTEKLRM